MRLLLIKDYQMLGRTTLGGMRAVYAADWVESAEDAQDAISTTGYDLLVLDVKLPSLSGPEWIARIRKTNNNIPCFLLTARDANYHKVEGRNADADDYLSSNLLQATDKATDMVQNLLTYSRLENEKVNGS